MPDPALRDDLAESGLAFWAGDIEQFRATAHYIEVFTLTQLWVALRRQLPQEIALADAPTWLNSTSKLYRLYRTIRRTHEQPNKAEVANVPLCLSRDGRLCRPTSLAMPDSEPVLYELLADDPAAPLVAKEIYESKEYRGLYDDFGVKAFDWAQVIERLEKLARAQTTLTQAHACLNTREKLLRFYRYLSGHRAAFGREHIELLRHRLPIWLCRDDMLRVAKDLELPPDSSNLPACITLNTVIPIERRESLHPLFEEVLGLKALDSKRFIEQHLLPQYSALDRKEQREALKFLRSQTQTLRDDPALLRTVQAVPLIEGDDNQFHRPIDLCFPRAGLRNLFPDRFHLPHASYDPTEDLQHWPWYDLFRTLGINHYAPPQVVLDEIKLLIQRPPRQHRDAIEKLFRYLEEHWESAYRNSSLGAKLRDLKWLPADGGDQTWYRPCDLYSRMEKPLVSYVAHILGFNEARRPSKAISDALEFPTTVRIKDVVNQLLALSKHGEPASPLIYLFLNRDAVTEDDLKPLRGHKVIYNDDSKRYWNAEQIFLSNQKRFFGSYRGYVTDAEIRPLFLKLGAKTEPVPKDYLDLLHEISAKHRERVPNDEANFVEHAYQQIAGVSDELLAVLTTLPCVLSSIGDEPLALRRADSVIFQPPDRFIKELPDIPIARYNPLSEPTLRHIGVRAIEELLQVDFQLTPDLSRPFLIQRYFGNLEYAIRRLLYHWGRIETEAAILAQLKRLDAYYQRAIQVSYHVTLAGQTFSSKLINEKCYYDTNKHHVYLRDQLSEREQQSELAQVFQRVLDFSDVAPSLLKELIAEPRCAREILDYNRIKALPTELDLAPPDETPTQFIIGDSSDEIAGDLPDVQSDKLYPPDRSPQIDIDPIQAPLFGEGNGIAPTQPIPPKSPVVSKPGHPNGGNHTPGASSEKSPTTTEPKNGMPANGTTKPKPNGPTKGPMPTALRDPAAPPFEGPTTMSSPTIATDMDGLSDRVRHWAETRGLPLDGTTTPVPPPRRRSVVPPEPSETNIARFVLSYPEVTRGFLRITGSARKLFLSRPTQITCNTEFGRSFSLWLIWHLDTPIAYNQQALRDFFLDQSIPAGGIVYLERQHGEHYRLFYNHAPHTVDEVRIAFNEQGQVRYETILGAEVVCETDEAIYRAEKRFEDQGALWLEAVGKKSVEETLCDLLMAAPDGWRHQDDLIASLAAERMVAAPTVRQTLSSKPYFIPDGNGNWRLDPATLLAASQNDVVAQWHKTTNRLLESDDAILSIAQATLRPPLNELRTRLLRLEAAANPTVSDDDINNLLAQVNADPYNDLLASGLERTVQRRIRAADVDLADDPQLRELFKAASAEVWVQVLRPILKQELKTLEENRHYERALALAQCWADFDSAHGSDLAQLSAYAQAWRLMNVEQPNVAVILEALRLAPTLLVARSKLHSTVQFALQQHPPDYWLAQGDDSQAVDAFFAHLNALSAARPYLEQTHQTAFDRTVQQEMQKLWPLLGDLGRIQLVLQMAAQIPTAHLEAREIEHLLHIAEQHHKDTLNGLLLGLAAWKLCTKGHYLQTPIANHLARCHIVLRIWEKANNRPWKAQVDGRLVEALQEGWRRNASTQMQREFDLLEQVKQIDESPLGQLLMHERCDLQCQIEREIERLASSAA